MNNVIHTMNEAFEKQFNTEQHLSDILNNKDLQIILVPDARDFDIHEWEAIIDSEDENADDLSEMLLKEDKEISKQKFIVTKNDVQAVLDKIATSDIFVAPYYKTTGFTKAKGLNTEDIKQIAKQLSPEDYNHSMISTKFKPGDILTVFITNKNFIVNGKNLSGTTLYIKIDADYGDMVAIVSAHTELGKLSKNPYAS